MGATEYGCIGLDTSNGEWSSHLQIHLVVSSTDTSISRIHLLDHAGMGGLLWGVSRWDTEPHGLVLVAPALGVVEPATLLK